MIIKHNQTHIGYFLKRNDINNIKVQDFMQELENFLFEANIMKQAIQHIQAKTLSSFDCSVGDWKCQIRTSMIIDLIKNTIFSNQELSNELIQIKDFISKNKDLFNKIKQQTTIEHQKLSKDLKKNSLHSYLEQYQLNYNPSKKTMLLSLCFLTTTSNNQQPIFSDHHVSIHKMKAFINQAKQTLCFLSIDYEQSLAQKYCSSEEQKALEQVEIKNIQHMTSLFSSFRAIYKKMHAEKQGFITHTFYFCACGGIQRIGIEAYISINNKFIKAIEPLDPKQPISVIEAYQYPGSLEQLQNLVGAMNEVDIPTQYFKSCTCENPTPQQSIESLDLALMAFFAQHPQFTNGAAINWDGLGLADSDLKKEYDYLLTLKGFSRKDMSIFHINHMFPATVEQALKPIEIPTQAIGSIAKHPHHLPTYLHCFHSDTGGKTMMQCNC